MSELGMSPALEISEETVKKAILALPETAEGLLARQLLTTLAQILRPLPSNVTELLAENEALKERVKTLEKEVGNHSKRLNGQYDKMVKTETELYRLDQYGRRNNLIVDGIPEDVKDDELESKSVEIFDKIGVKLKRKDIEAVHRVGGRRFGRPRKTIIRVVNRRKCEEIFKNKKKLHDIDGEAMGLGSNKIFVNSNLNKYFAKLFWNARLLQKKGKIFRAWYSNETVRIRLTEDSGVVTVSHQNELVNLFPEFDFSASD